MEQDAAYKGRSRNLRRGGHHVHVDRADVPLERSERFTVPAQRLFPRTLWLISV